MITKQNFDAAEARRARQGWSLFAVYLALYGTFVFLNAFAPELMEREFLLGVNLAVGYGMGLIVAAVVLSLVYALLCWAAAARSTEETME